LINIKHVFNPTNLFKEYGLRFLPDLYKGFNPITYDEACEMEVEIGIHLGVLALVFGKLN